MTDTTRDREAIQAVRSAFIAADLAGDAAAMQALLAEGVAILHPVCGVVEGRENAGRLMQQILGEVHATWRKEAWYSTVELRFSGDLAYERGHLSQILTPVAGGPPDRDEGMYLRIYSRHPDDGWRIACIAGTLTHDEPETEQTPCRT